ncbi:MAG: hydrogenase maturation peptidase HycI [Nanoarchaeota archaeon]
MRTVICGIGNKMKGDDGVGSAIASELEREIRKDNIMILDCASAPENFTGKVKSFNPDHVVLIDAVKMGRDPGHVEMVESENIKGLLFSTHQTPLKMLIDYIQQQLPSTKISFIGIEPKHTIFGSDMSEEVKAAMDELKTSLTNLLMGL